MSDTNSPDVVEQVTVIVATVARRPASSITPEATWQELGLDSLDLVDLAVQWEDAFGMVIPDEELIRLRTVDDVASFVIASR